MGLVQEGETNPTFLRLRITDIKAPALVSLVLNFARLFADPHEYNAEEVVLPSWTPLSGQYQALCS